MTHTRISYDPVMRMLMKNFMNQERETERRCHWMPATNISENEKSFQIEMAVPGFSKKDISISIEKAMLKVSSQLPKEDDSQEQKFRMKEFGRRDFCRTFNLGESIDQEGIKAEFNNGILTITLPRKEEVILKKEIQIL